MSDSYKTYIYHIILINVRHKIRTLIDNFLTNTKDDNKQTTNITRTMIIFKLYGLIEPINFSRIKFAKTRSNRIDTCIADKIIVIGKLNL